MGMAASQARLLSITSRMADNELRAQIINNSKMRLATESSKVSEEYINALNSATMMMNNYDTEGNSQYQELSFNSLTSYSSYNNQYGLVNSNGQLLVSEKDAENYRSVVNAGGGLDEFLAKYGLEYGSRYFTEETLGAKEIEIENAGTYTIEELEKIYAGDMVENEDGTVTGTHVGYNNALNSSEYVTFTDLYNEFTLAEENYMLEVSNAMNAYLYDKTWNTNYDKYVTKISDIKDFNTLKEGYNYILNKVNDLHSSGKLPDNDFYKEMQTLLGNIEFNGNSIKRTATDNVTVGDDGTIYLGAQYQLDGGNVQSELVAVPDKNGTYTIQVNPELAEYFESAGISITFSNGSSSISGVNLSNFQYTVTEKADPDEEGATDEVTTYNYSYNGGKTASVTWNVTDIGEASEAISELFLAFKGGAINGLDKEQFLGTSESAKSAKEQYDAAFDALIDFIFGTNLNASLKEDVRNNASMLNDPGLILKWANENNVQTSEKFEVIKDIYIMDCLFDAHGEPAWGWTDVNDPDGKENAEAKVQWYTNLYNRMQKGYRVIEEGLASSNEWIQYALESGLVTLEQVDKSNNWTSTIYSNCSDITEVTDDVAVTKAEAEYNKAMNNIENKDKRYDMELKNIDTEHNSLQTEYDSVKSVIDKNIERSFKIYS